LFYRAVLNNKKETVMSHQPYYPTSEAGEIKWLSNFINKLPSHSSTLKLPADQVSGIISDVQFYLWVLQHQHPAIQHYSLESTAYKGLIANGSGTEPCPLPVAPVFSQLPAVRLPGVLRRLANFTQLIKLSSAYSESIGQDLGIISSKNGTAHLLVEFVFSQDRGSNGDRVKLMFKKHGHDGIWIEGRRNDGNWEFLGVTTVKPWYDERPLSQPNVPEIREYRLRWWDKSEPNGDFSPVQKVTVGP
jgi:hypothetical protein